MMKSTLFKFLLLPISIFMIGCAAPNLTDSDANRMNYYRPTSYSAGYDYKTSHMLVVPLNGMDHQLFWNLMNNYEPDETRMRCSSAGGEYQVVFYDDYTKRVTYSNIGEEHMYFVGPRSFLNKIASKMTAKNSLMVELTNFKAVFKEDIKTVKEIVSNHEERRGFSNVFSKSEGNAVTKEYVNGGNRLVTTETPKELTLIFEGDGTFIHFMIHKLSLLH